jgi:glycosyltransferase involved in cell wall biosynthesis
VLFSCGAFYERKGFPFLIDMFAKVAPLYPKATLRIAGDGPEREKVIDRIRFHGLQDRITLLGQLPHETILQEMVWCDVFVLVGWDEPFATVYSEATSAGKPIVLCNDGGFNDVFRNEVHGLSIPPRNLVAGVQALSVLLGSPEKRQRMGRASRDLFETYLHWDHHAARMVRLLEAAAGSVGGSRMQRFIA